MRFITILILMALTSFAMAANLEKKDVETWLKSVTELQTWLEQQEEKLAQEPEFDEALEGQAALEQAIEQLKKVGVYSDFNKKVVAAGYKDVMHWLTTSQQISMAYLAVLLEGEVGQRAELEAQRKQLVTLDLPAEQKEMLENIVASSLAMLDGLEEVSEADRAAVRPYIERLEAAMGE